MVILRAVYLPAGTVYSPYSRLSMSIEVISQTVLSSQPFSARVLSAMAFILSSWPDSASSASSEDEYGSNSSSDDARTASLTLSFSCWSSSLSEFASICRRTRLSSMCFSDETAVNMPLIRRDIAIIAAITAEFDAM